MTRAGPYPLTPLPEYHRAARPRIAWANADARDRWQPLLTQAREGLPTLALLLVEETPDLRLPLLLTPDISHKLRGLAIRRGMTLASAAETARLPWNLTTPSAHSAVTLVLARRRPPRQPSEPALRPPDDDAYRSDRTGVDVPACCRAASARRDPPEAARLDPWWLVATAASAPEDVSPSGDGSRLRVELPPDATRLLLRHALGLPTPWWLPCSPLCPDTAAAEVALGALAEQCGGHRLTELDTMPVEWSSLHGVAEIKTPLFRLIRPSPNYAETLVVRIGGEPPQYASTGTRFPYPSRLTHRRPVPVTIRSKAETLRPPPELPTSPS